VSSLSESLLVGRCRSHARATLFAQADQGLGTIGIGTRITVADRLQGATVKCPMNDSEAARKPAPVSGVARASKLCRPLRFSSG
jgi:hypothetical protein